MKKIDDERETGMTQIGYCIYCGQATQIPVEKETDQEQIDQWATQRCDCDRAKRQQDWESTKNQSETYIDSLFKEDYPDVAEILKGNVERCFKEKIDKINIKCGQMAATMERKETDKGIKIKINRTDTIKSTRTAEK